MCFIDIRTKTANNNIMTWYMVIESRTVFKFSSICALITTHNLDILSLKLHCRTAPIKVPDTCSTCVLLYSILRKIKLYHYFFHYFFYTRCFHSFYLLTQFYYINIHNYLCCTAHI